jgi:hypothetical protein
MAAIREVVQGARVDRLFQGPERTHMRRGYYTVCPGLDVDGCSGASAIKDMLALPALMRTRGRPDPESR